MPSAAQVIMFWGTAIISPLIILGNLAACIFVPGKKSMRTFTKVLLLNLAMADMCYGLLKVVELVTLKLIAEVRDAVTFCRAATYITFLCCAVSIVTLTAVAGERYLAVIKPVKYFQRSQNSKAALYGSIATWLVTGLIMVPSIHFHDHDSTGEDFFCAIHLERGIFSYVHISVIMLIFILLPTVLVVLSYTLVIRKLWARPGSSQVTNSRLLKSRKTLTKLLLTITVIFVVCWITIVVENCLYIAGYYSETFDVLCRILVQLRSATDPVLYAFYGITFRRNLKKIFHRSSFGRRTKSPGREVKAIKTYRAAKDMQM